MSSPQERCSAENQAEEINSPEHRARHRITIFGSGVDSEQQSTLKFAAEITQQLMQLSGFKLATGGINSGIMRVVAREAMRIARKLKRKELRPEAVAPKSPKKWRFRKNPTPGKVEYEIDPLERTRRLVDESDGMVILNGGPGTITERDYALRRRERIASEKPIVILDETGKHLEEMEEDFQLPEGDEFKLSAESLRDVYVAQTAEDAQFVMEMYYRKKYGIEITEEEISRLYDLHIGHSIPGFNFEGN